MAPRNNAEDKPITGAQQQVNVELINYRMDKFEDALDANTKVTNQVLQEVRAINYVPMQDFTDYKEIIESKFNALQKYGDQIYRKKDDGKNFRVFAVAVGTAVTITVVTMVVLFLGKGIFNGQ